MIIPTSGAFARQHTLRNKAQFPEAIAENPRERLHGLIAFGFPGNSLSVQNDVLYMEHHESNNRTAL